MLITRRLGFEPKSAVDDAMRALSGLDWTDPGAGLLAYYPVVRGNPFQALLYSRLDSVGVAPVPTYDLPTTAQVAAAVRGSGLRFGVHVHWLNVVMAKAEDEHDARARMKEYLEGLHQLVDAGARVMWTVHNILPHETRWPELEAELRRGVVAAADQVHVMSPRTQELVSPWFEIPDEKLRTVAHPSYADVYPSWMSREQARRELGIAPDQIVFLLIGRVQPYKGLTELMAAFDALCEAEPGRYTLLAAGPPNTEPETQEFSSWIRTHPTALGALRKLGDDELQVFLRAADIAVFPYRRSLNSGALALGLTFGLPAILPDDIGEAREDGFALTYSRADPDGLRHALGRAPELLTEPVRDAAAAAAARIAPHRVGAEFAAQVRQWLDQAVCEPVRGDEA